MALITTLCDTTSDSYDTLDGIESNLYGSNLRNWKAIQSVAEKEAYARRATQLIDMQLYRGDVYDSGQGLAFPRGDHFEYADDGVTAVPYLPVRVKLAFYAQIASLINQESSGLASQIMDYRGMGVTKIALGDASLTFAGSGAGNMGASRSSAKDLLCTEARSLLSVYFAHSTIRLERA